MTTANIMFAQPGGGMLDHEHDARKVLWALLAAIFIHLVVAYLLAVWGGVFSPAAPIEEQPVQLTFVDLPQAPLVRALRVLTEGNALARAGGNARLELETALLRCILAAEDPSTNG